MFSMVSLKVSLLFTGQECAELRIPWENVQLEKQKSICEANFAWIFACYWNGMNSNQQFSLSDSLLLQINIRILPGFQPGFPAKHLSQHMGSRAAGIHDFFYRIGLCPQFDQHAFRPQMHIVSVCL